MLGSLGSIVRSILAFALLATLSGFSAVVAQSQPLNLLIIQTDEHNFRTLGCYRDLLPEDQAMVWGAKAKVETPHIDSIARRGAICTSFYATSPVCTPSRAALLTGLYPQNTGAHTNNQPLHDSVETIASRLKKVGYRTGYSGKWHLDGPAKPGWDPKRNFGFDDNRYMFNRGHWKQLEVTTSGARVKAQDAKGRPSYSVNGADERSFATDWLTDRTIEFIESDLENPFCYVVNIPDPHGPNTVRAPYDSMFDPADFSRPRTFDQTKEQTPLYLGPLARQFSPAGMAKYFGMVKCIDDNVGRILDSLRENGLLERTVVIMTSDHGDLCGEHHLDNKGNPYEASARVPFVIAAPGVLKPNMVLHQAMGSVDFVPTILPLLGLGDQVSESAFEGRNLSQAFLQGESEASRENIIFLRKAGNEPGWVAAVTDRYKLVLSANDQPWLFDLQLDPDELTNYYSEASHTETRRRLARALQEYGPKFSDPHLRNPKLRNDCRSAAE